MKNGLKTLALVATLVIVGGIATAAIPAADGTISACYKKTTKILRVINAEAGQVCNADERPLTWNQAGQPGTPGTDGTNGTDGVSGYERVVAQFSQPAGQGVVSYQAFCASGNEPLGGGWAFTPGFGASDDAAPLVRTSQPFNGGWVVQAKWSFGFFEVYVTCANV